MIDIMKEYESFYRKDIYNPNPWMCNKGFPGYYLVGAMELSCVQVTLDFSLDLLESLGLHFNPAMSATKSYSCPVWVG